MKPTESEEKLFTPYEIVGPRSKRSGVEVNGNRNKAQRDLDPFLMTDQMITDADQLHSQKLRQQAISDDKWRRLMRVLNMNTSCIRTMTELLLRKMPEDENLRNAVSTIDDCADLIERAVYHLAKQRSE